MQDKLVSRKRECDELQRCLESDRSELVIISGRRRIGKTYLIDNTWYDAFNALPFNLRETEEYLRQRDCQWDRYQLLQCHMIFGGVPFYLSLLNPADCLAQNIDRLFFAEGAQLKGEFDELYNTLSHSFGRAGAILAAPLPVTWPACSGITPLVAIRTDGCADTDCQGESTVSPRRVRVVCPFLCLKTPFACHLRAGLLPVYDCRVDTLL